VDEVQVDVEDAGGVRGLRLHQVRVPDLLEQRARAQGAASILAE
jgi:hypothetical protein